MLKASLKKTEKLLNKFLCVALCAIFLTACNDETVRFNLSQNQATQIVAILSQYGISSNVIRDTAGSESYNVNVKQGYYNQAISILDQRKDELDQELESFEELTATKGLLPSSREMEALKLDRALSLQLAELIKQLPEVYSVKALLHSSLLDEKQKPSVSLAITEYPGLSLDPSKVKALVQKAVTGIKDEDIFISISPKKKDEIKIINSGLENQEGRLIYVPLRPFLKAFRVAEADYNGIVILLLILFVLAAAFFAAIGFLVGYRYEIISAYGARRKAAKDK